MPKVKFITSHPSKFQAIPTTSSSSPSPIGSPWPYQPNGTVRLRAIEHEKVFDTSDYRVHSQCTWTLDFLRQNWMLSILVPATVHIYPQPIRLFYQNMTYDNDNAWVKIRLDVWTCRFTTTDLADILNLPLEYGTMTRPHLSPTLTFNHTEATFLGVYQSFSTDTTKGSEETIHSEHRAEIL